MVEKNNKSIKWIILLSIMSIFLSSCVSSLIIEEKEQFFLSHKNVEIKITGMYDMRFFYILTIKSIKGNIEVHPKELKLTSIPIADTIRVNGLYYQKKVMTQSFILNQGEVFEYKFNISPDTQKGFIIDEIHILPCDFITYQGIPLINSAIKIKVR